MRYLARRFYTAESAETAENKNEKRENGEWEALSPAGRVVDEPCVLPVLHFPFFRFLPLCLRGRIGLCMQRDALRSLRALR